MAAAIPSSILAQPPTEQKVAEPIVEHSISTWKTGIVQQAAGIQYVQVNQGSDGNDALVGRVFKVIRYEMNGGKVIISVAASILGR